MKQTLHTDEQDAKELARFGYQQQLRRSLGTFSSFALAFSLISINTGIFANFRHGYQQVGPALVWSWLVVLGGQTLVDAFTTPAAGLRQGHRVVYLGHASPDPLVIDSAGIGRFKNNALIFRKTILGSRLQAHLLSRTLHSARRRLQLSGATRCARLNLSKIIAVIDPLCPD
jgi:hypothetical protein